MYFFKDINALQIICFTLAIIIIFYMSTNNYIYQNFYENFDNDSNLILNKKFTQKNNDNLYDDFYVNYYDNLFFNKSKNDFEIVNLIKNTNMNKKSYILDIGSGTGHHVSSLHAHKLSAIGIDKSNSMIIKSKNMYPTLNFKKSDALNSMLFFENTFTHIISLYFTIYYIKNKNLFFSNCFKWLMPGGFLAIHLVDRENFNPIVPASDLFYHASMQDYSDKRIDKSIVQFIDNNSYRSKFDYLPNEDLGIFKETFKSKQNNVRNQEHTLYMPTHESILNVAKSIGFNLKNKIDMKDIRYNYQYIYILQKPN